REVAGDVPAGVETAGGVGVGAAGESVGGRVAATQPCEDEGAHLERAAGLEVDEGTQAPVVRDLAGDGPGDERPLVDLLRRRQVAANLEAPRLRRQGRETHDAQGYLDLGRPAAGGPPRLRLPVLVPREVELGVVVADPVDHDAGGVDAEMERRLAVAA